MAAAATPIGATDGVLVLLQLGGGNDGLSMVVPDAGPRRPRPLPRRSAATSPPPTRSPSPRASASTPACRSSRPATTPARSPSCGAWARPAATYSHFTSTATWMAGTTGAARDTGWLGRWLDGVPESAGRPAGRDDRPVGAAPPPGPIGGRHRTRVERRPLRRRPARGLAGARVRRDQAPWAPAPPAAAGCPTWSPTPGPSSIALAQTAVADVHARAARRFGPPVAHPGRPADQRRPRRAGDRLLVRQLRPARRPLVGLPEAPLRARRGHRGVLRHPVADVPQPGHPRHLLRVRPHRAGQRLGRLRPRHRVGRSS